MVIPAAIYAMVNVGSPGMRGWGVPMATDIAFALGVLALLGDRVPAGLKVFLAALAIVDDIDAVLVIAVFYSSGVAWEPLAGGAVLLLLAVGLNRAGARRPWTYGAIGLALWATVLLSGIHATVPGVLLAFAIPVRTRLNEGDFMAHARRAWLTRRQAAGHRGLFVGRCSRRDGIAAARCYLANAHCGRGGRRHRIHDGTLHRRARVPDRFTARRASGRGEGRHSGGVSAHGRRGRRAAPARVRSSCTSRSP
jgi:Na+/H+ antiporter 1